MAPRASTYTKMPPTSTKARILCAVRQYSAGCQRKLTTCGTRSRPADIFPKERSDPFAFLRGQSAASRMALPIERAVVRLQIRRPQRGGHSPQRSLLFMATLANLAKQLRGSLDAWV